MSTPQSKKDFRPVAKYKLDNGKTISLNRKAPQDGGTPTPSPSSRKGSIASQPSSRRPSAALSQASPGRRPSLQPSKLSGNSNSNTSLPKSQFLRSADTASNSSRGAPPKLPPRPQNGQWPGRRGSFSNQSEATIVGPPKTARKLSVSPRKDSSTASKSPRRASKIGARKASQPETPSRPPPKKLSSANQDFSPSPKTVPSKQKDPKGATEKPKQTPPRRPSTTPAPPLSRQISQQVPNDNSRRPSTQQDNAKPQPPRRPSAAPQQNQSDKPSAPRRPSTLGSEQPEKVKQDLPRRPSATPTGAQDQPRRPSATPISTSNRSVSQRDQSDRPNASRRPSSIDTAHPGKSNISRPKLSPTPSGRRVSFQDDAKREPDEVKNMPKLNEEDGEQEESAKARPRKLARRKSAGGKPRKLGKPAQPAEKGQLPEDDKRKKEVDTLAKDDRDLKSYLSEKQRGDLTLLIADITRQMRHDIETHFDASKGLHLIKGNGDEEDALENLDFNPGTADVSAYDKERKLRGDLEKELSKPETKKLKDANLNWFDEWRQGVILRVGEAVNSKETASKQDEEAEPETEGRRPSQTMIRKVDAGGKGKAAQGPTLEDLFPRVKTPLTKIPMKERTLILHSMLLMLLSLEHYNAASRVLLLYLTSSLKIGLSSLRNDEENTAQGLLKAAKEMTADEETRKRLEEGNDTTRKWKIRLASAAGAAVIGYTGGLAAPMIAAGVGSVMSELGLGATAAAGYLGSVASSTAVVGGIFGAYGGRMTGQVMDNISAGVQDFAFLPIHGERKAHADNVTAATTTRRLRVIVAISGWLLEKEEVVTPWHVLKPSAEVFALRFELEAMLNLGQSFDTMLQSAVYGYAQSAAVKQTVFAELMNGMMWPMALTKVARVVDNPFNIAITRADKAGQVLADALINRVQGERPVTLIAYSVGARVIQSCLTSLAKRKAFGLVESAVLMGAPIASDTKTWRLMRSAVLGRLVNVYSENDYLLAFLYRASSLQYGVAGLVPVTGLAGVENVDVTENVSGHLRYRYLVGSILQKIRFEDVDSTEVANEAKAFEKAVEEEEKRTYLAQAGELYQNYKGKKPESKRNKKSSGDNLEISDADAEKEAEKMEKTVDEKTQSSLMQWAAEQLYLSKPGEKAKPTDGKAMSEKTYYDWAREGASYLSRSGDKSAEKTKKNKKSQPQQQQQPKKAKKLASAKKPASSDNKDQEKGNEKKEEQQQSTGTSSYMPSSYVPTFGSKTKPKEPAKPDDNDDKKEEDGKDDKNAKDDKDDEEEQATGISSYMPSSYVPTFGTKTKPKEPAKPDTNDDKNEEEDGEDDKNDKNAKDDKDEEEKQATGISSYMPSSYVSSFGAKSKSKDKETKDEAPKEDKKDEDKDDAKPEPESSPSKQATDESKGYSSYLPTWGFGSTTKQDKGKGKEEPAQHGDDASQKLDDKDEDEQPSTPPTQQTPKPSDRPAAAGDEGQGDGQSTNAMTTDTEAEGQTDDDPFTSPPKNGSNAFAEGISKKDQDGGEKDEEKAGEKEEDKKE